MYKFIFQQIKFYSGSYKEIKKKFDQGGVLVAPAASALTSIKDDQRYHKSLIDSDIAILDSGFFCILLRIFQKNKVIKLSGYLFLSRFLEELKKIDKIFLINPSIKEDKINKKYLLKKNIKNFKTYVAPHYKTIKDDKLIKKIKLFKPKYIMINIGGGIQEPLGVYLKKELNFKVSILCTGAAIAFLTKEQAPINKIVDRLYLGWLVRLLWSPLKHYKRTFLSIGLIKFFFK